MDHYGFNEDIRNRVRKEGAKPSHNQETLLREAVPFNSKSHQVTKNFKTILTPILGEFTRAVSNVSLVKEAAQSDEMETYIESLLVQVAEDVDVDDEESRNDLVRFLKTFLFAEGGEINPVHPAIYKFIPTKLSKAAVERRLAIYAKEALVQDKHVFAEIFNKTGQEDIITGLILEKLDDGVTVERKDEKPSYKPLLPKVSRLFENDLRFLAEHQQYFLEHYAKFINYFLFLYLSQLSLCFDEYEGGKYDEVRSFTYGVDWEAINKRRDTVDDTRRLFQRVDNLFIHVNVLAQLSHVNFNDGRDFLTYVDLMEQVHQASSEDQERFLINLNAWITHYTELIEVEHVKGNANSIAEAFRNLKEYVEKGVSDKVRSEYNSSVKFIAKEHFLKNRGNLGAVLNVNQDFLLMMTALCVKDERIPLNQLFAEYEKRGIRFDNHSQVEVIQLLDNLNIIDKKSDSGDAQYVKPIL
ncbi:DNA phosphorothioation-dependent restriction protein DptG [Shouchella shacheensis]|uniref:DNA phosphorothioation-dependent restriction protein DptG n=1 Tax=Shouchella shacheensis TaxID=1649580 RepID=UPI00073FAA3C|nr:DNA phosphorothioation-dependent restriction protein DptG [Shouchella shacheensis]